MSLWSAAARRRFGCLLSWVCHRKQPKVVSSHRTPKRPRIGSISNHPGLPPPPPPPLPALHSPPGGDRADGERGRLAGQVDLIPHPGQHALDAEAALVVGLRYLRPVVL